MSSIEVVVAGQKISIQPETSYFELLGADKKFLAAKVNGVVTDISLPAKAEEQIEGIEIGSDDGLAILRHSTAHVMAQAVQQIYPEAHL